MSVAATTETGTEAPLTEEQIIQAFGEDDDSGTENGEGKGAEGAAEGDGTDPDIDDGAENGEEQPNPYDSAPEFWSAERKALWEKIQDPALRQALHEIDKERSTATAKKIEEAALGRKDIETKLQQHEQERDQLVAFWKDLAPKLAQSFQSKWAAVDWQKLSAENPAEYVRLKAQADADLGLIQQAAERHKVEIDKANARAATSLAENKRAEHAKLVEKFPEHFGGDKAQKTYDDLRDYLIAQGTPAGRIPHIYESFVVGTALKAMLYDKAKAAAAQKRSGASTQQQSATATQTSARITPGPARRAGNLQGAEATRQAEQRLRTGQDLSDDDVARLFG